MPQAEFDLGGRLLSIEWDKPWRNLRATLDDVVVTNEHDSVAINNRISTTVMLPDQSRLELRVAPYWGFLNLIVHHDGRFVGATGGEPLKHLNHAAIALAVTGVANILSAVFLGPRLRSGGSRWSSGTASSSAPARS